MTNDWTSKERIALLFNILEFGDQPESWSAISNDLSRTYQTKKDGKYSIKNCKQEYKQLVNRYKSEWIQHGSSNGLKIPLAKYISIQLKSIYRSELTNQLNENRKKLTELYLHVETTVNIKSNTIESTTPASVIEITTPLVIPQEHEQLEERISTIEHISQSVKPISDISSNESIHLPLPSEINSTSSIFDNSLKEQTTFVGQIQIKEEANIEIPTEPIRQNSSIISPKFSTNEQDIPHQTLIDSPSLNISSDHQLFLSHPIHSIPLITPTILPESTSSSRSTSRTSSETKTDIIKIIPTTTPKYHVYFSPKNSINNNFGINKIKPKRKTTDDLKDENENDTINQHDIPSSSSSLSTEQSKTPSLTAPMTRRSINTRSVPNTAAEQEEEKLRKFSAMLSENPNSWQSQSMAIIQFLLAHKQGYFFEHEITDEIAPKYHQYIRHPIALDTIRKTLESNGYQTKEYFRRDIYLMLYNAMKYNPRHHHVHRSAKHLFNITLPLFNLSPQDIHGQIPTKSNISLPTTINDVPSIKRQRIK